MDELEPAKKARQSVSEVIVIDGPACLIASEMRFSLLIFKEI